MKEELCPAFGGRNPADTEFCVQCGTYLGWEDKRPHDSRSPGPGAAVDTQLRVEVEQQDAVVVTPGARPSPVALHLANVSTVVEAHRVAAVSGPRWLTVTSGHTRLLPGTEGRVQLTLAIDAKDVVPIHRFRLRVRVQGESSRALWREVGVDAVVGTVRSPAQLRLEPSQVRARGDGRAAYRVVLDNR